ncbi:hypothetical protein Pmar_PMAR028997 [Perkinsus marinus ATCC 50983]|uniref:NHL repeat-containing protein n=1 Tax=Perkinsus marinus (strain ATCC 50983 / TXsc) TaxID=423536 RepID=C5L681_PERM5|nr:hypothetical protein Pmar_PMAR028997 [Perkinsus marinus ATCC 50983]EER07708.1 hypothetical protein Pmar_PMAR028997 [Perkinsus marinus ATCC 50983]|eukprot:XP_002775892.1 hypothetical protein Pmar_PMAR028997 [Perkinsus marinus ATCC 50983]
MGPKHALLECEDDDPLVDQLAVEAWAFARPSYQLAVTGPALFTKSSEVSAWVVESPQKLAIQNGRLLVTDLIHDRILSVSVEHPYTDTIVYATVSKPLGLCYDEDGGGVFCTLMDEDNVCLLDPGDVEPYAVVGPAVDPDSDEHDLTEPRAVQMSNRGTVLWVCDSGNHRLLRVDRRTFTVTSVCEDIGLRWPEDICICAGSSVAVADTDNDRVVVYTPTNGDGEVGSVQEVLGPSSEYGRIKLRGPGAVVSDPLRKVLYVGDSYNGRIVCCPYQEEFYDDGAGTVVAGHEGLSVTKTVEDYPHVKSHNCSDSTTTSPPMLRFGQPFVVAENVGRVSGMVVDEGTGNIYVSDRVNHVVRILRPVYY